VTDLLSSPATSVVPGVVSLSIVGLLQGSVVLERGGSPETSEDNGLYFTSHLIVMRV